MLIVKMASETDNVGRRRKPYHGSAKRRKSTTPNDAKGVWPCTLVQCRWCISELEMTSKIFEWMFEQFPTTFPTF